MVSNNLLELGMPKWIDLFKRMAFLGVILTTLSTPRKWESPLSSLFFMLTILFLLVVIQTI